MCRESCYEGGATGINCQMRDQIRDFWALARRQAWKETREWLHDHPEVTMSGIVIAVLGVLAIWWGLDRPDEAFEETVLKGVGTLTILAALPWVYWRRLKGVIAQWNAEKLEKIEQLETQISKLTSAPDRIGLVEMAAIAKAKYGWDFKADDHLFFDFIDGIRHAVSDGVFNLEGRKGCLGQPEDRKNFYFIVPIPRDHVRKTQIDVPGFFKDAVSNYAIRTWSFSDDVLSRDLYCDIHIDSSAKAISWLEDGANPWKGQRAQAEASAEARSEQFRRELREQGVTHTVPDGTMQGRVWNPGDPPEGRKVE